MTILPKKDRPNNHGSSHIINGTAWLTVANFVTMVLGLILVMVSTRKFTANDFGGYVLMVLMSGLLTQITTLGLGVATSRYLAVYDDPAKKELLVNTALSLRLVVFGVTSLVACAFAPFLFKLFNATMQTSIFYFVLPMFFVNSFNATMQSILQGLFSFKVIAVWDIASTLLNLIFLFILIALPLDSLTVLAGAYLLAYLIAGIYMFISIPVRKRFVLDLDQVKELVRFGFPLQVNDILSFFYGRIDTIIIAALLAPANIAYFEIAGKIPGSLLAFFDAFFIVFFPLISKYYSSGEYKKAEDLLNNSLRVITFISLFLAGVTLLFGEDIIRLLFSEQYVAITPVFIILMVALSLTLIGYLLGRSLVAVGESDKPPKVNLSHAGVSLISSWILIPPLGILGAAITHLIGPIVTNPLNYYFLNRKFPIRVLGAYLKPLVIFAGWSGAVLLFFSENLLFKISAIIIFLILNIIFSVISKDDIVFMRFVIEDVAKIPLKRLRVFWSRASHENTGN